MANQKYFIRYSKIIYRIKIGDYPSLTTVLNYLLDNDFDINKRTFNRDINAILDLFEIEIVYSRNRKGYFIEATEENYSAIKLKETLDLFSSIKIIDNDKHIISFEKRKSKGIEHIYSITTAIKDSKTLSFKHKKHNDTETSQRSVSPYQLRESQGKWYLVAKDEKDNKIKTFGLDRMSLLQVENTLFNSPKDVDFDKMFSYSFGVINTNNPESIKIQVFGAQALFIKNYPLHQSQKIIDANNESIIFSLKLSITDDFVMELMKYGANIMIIAPQELRTKMYNQYQKAIKRYQ